MTDEVRSKPGLAVGQQRNRTRARSLPIVDPIIRLAQWLAAASGLGAATLRQGARPLTWRRPVRAEFARFMELASVRAIPSVVVTGGLLGLAVITQYLYWVEKLGQQEIIDDIFDIVVVRELTPLLVGFLVLGRSGLLILHEVGSLRKQGQYRMLDAQGIDPFLIIVIPRVLAVTLSVFCLSIVFIIATFTVGHVAAIAVGVTVDPLLDLPVALLEAIGSVGYATLPVKTLAIGFTIGVVCCVTAMEDRPESDKDAHLMPRGFVRSVLAILLVSGLTSIVLPYDIPGH